MRHVRTGPTVAAAAALVLTTGALGCQSYVFEPAIPALISVSNTTYQIPDVASADILFVIDDSGSMAGEQANLAANFDVFINALETENDNRRASDIPIFRYRLAVASTSVSLKYQLADGTIFDQTTYSSDTNCQSTYPITFGDPYPVGQFLAAPGNQAILDSESLTGQAIISQFTQNAQLGVCGSGQEQGLLAARRALEAHPGFVRDKSRLVVVFLSDEEDCSDPNGDLILSTSTDLCIEEAGKAGGGLLGPVSEYADFFQGLAAVAGSDVIIGSIVSANGVRPNITPGLCTDSACEAACTTGNPRADPCYCGGFSAGGRYLQLADLVGNGSLKDSICQSSFSDTLRLLAEVIIKVDVIYLQTRPFEDDPSLVLLKIIRDGEDILCTSPTDATQTCADGVDWEYDPGDIAIRLCNTNNCTIQPGDSYKVSFVEKACSADNPC